MHCTVYIATSLDGFIARRDGSIDWLTGISAPAGEDYGYAEFMGSIDAVVLGRRTYETVLGFGGDWPYTRPVYVLSSTLRGVREDLRAKVTLLNADPSTALEHIRSDGHSRCYVDGGQTIRRFLQDDLIDRLIVTRVPLLLGDGLPLFGPTGRDLAWTHLRTETYANGLVKSEYVRRRA